MTTFFTSDISVLLKIFSNNYQIAFVFDPHRQLVEDAPHDFRIVASPSTLTEFFTPDAALFCLSTDGLKDDFWVKNLFRDIFILNQNFIKPLNSNSFYQEKSYFYFVNNPNRTLRWVFPENLTYPSFLALYNASGIKAKIIQTAFKISFMIGLKEILTSGSFSFFSSKKSEIKNLIQAAQGEGYSIFTGTVGENRKAIIEIHQSRQTTHFIKFPLNEKSEKLVEHERLQLQRLAAFNFQKSVLPTVTAASNPKVAILSNVRPANETFATHHTLQDLHLNALTEWYEATLQSQKISQLPDYQAIKKNITNLQHDNQPTNDLRSDVVQNLIEGLQRLFDRLDPETTCPTALAQNDFTPWNMYCTARRLHIYDWELSKDQLPVFFDAFHFIFQSNILILKTPFSEIKKQLTALESNTYVKKVQQKYPFDLRTHYQFYLLATVSYYLNLYLRQTPLHPQAHWLVGTWNDAINDFLG